MEILGIALETLFLCAALLLSLAAALFALLVAAAPSALPAAAVPRARPRIAVLVPAHDEADGIAATLDSVRRQLAPGDRLLVVADNCSDLTAEVARAAGAEAVERRDPARRGKSYALEFGVAHLAADPPQVVIVVDADCQLGPGALGALAHAAAAGERPAQAAYLMHAQDGAHPGKQVAQFAWAVKNLLRPLGWQRLGMGCQLTGSGMAFPWALLREAPLANGHIAEDLQLGLDFASAGKAPVFCREAVVTSVFAENVQGERAQRTRWEHGHLALIGSHGIALLVRALQRRDARLAALALDLCVPPLSLLMLLGLTSGGAGLLGWGATGHGAWLAGCLPPLLLAGAVALAWCKAGRQALPPRQLPHVLWYMLAKVPLYLRFLVRRQVAWVGATRDRR